MDGGRRLIRIAHTELCSDELKYMFIGKKAILYETINIVIHQFFAIYIQLNTEFKIKMQ